MRILHYIAYQIAILRNGTENLKTISLILYEHYVNNTNHGNVFICGIVIRTCSLSCMSVALFTQEHHQKSILIMPPSFLISHMGGWGYGRQVYGLVWWIYCMSYILVPWCCVIYYTRQSHCRGSTVRLIVVALDLCGRMPKNACRGICRTDSVRTDN